MVGTAQARQESLRSTVCSGFVGLFVLSAQEEGSEEDAG